MQVELVASYEAIIQAVWLKNFVSMLYLVNSTWSVIVICCDNASMHLFLKTIRDPIA